MSVRLETLKPGDRFRWVGAIFELADEPPLQCYNYDGPYRRVVYREARGIARPGDTGIMPCATEVEAIGATDSPGGEAGFDITPLDALIQLSVVARGSGLKTESGRKSFDHDRTEACIKVLAALVAKEEQ
jgi:hypothetical protein